MTKKNFFFHVRTNLLLVRIGFLKLHIYPLATFLNVISSIIFIMLQYFLWKSIYHSNLKTSYMFGQLFTYLFISQIIFAIYPSNAGKDLSSFVKNGDIIHLLLKPTSIIRQIFFDSIGESIYRFLSVSVPVYIIVFLSFSKLAGVSRLFMLQTQIILIFSYIFLFLFEILIGLCSFYTTSIWGIQSLKYAILTLLSGRFLPLSLYPERIRMIVENLPFKIMYYTPLQFIIGKSTNSFIEIISYQFICIVTIYIIVRMFYSSILRKLMIQGG